MHADATHIAIAQVVAAGENNVIGAGGALLWKISDDLKWFRQITMGKPIVMGRKTFASIGKPLPGRDKIVISRAMDFSADGIFITHTIDEALALARECASRCGADEICIIGGGEIYAQTLGVAERIYLTRVAAAPAGDAFFPAIDSDEWREKRVSGCEKSDRNQYACDFVILERRAGAP